MLGILLMTLAALAAPIYVDPSGVAAAAPKPQQLSYDATEPKGRRKAAKIDTRSEDFVLDAPRRAKVQANAEDLARNFAVARWMIRKHLDFVTCFEFQSLSGNDDLDDQVEALIANWSQAQHCDRAGRHPLWRMIRLAEAQRTINGDVGLLKLTDGRLQGIESDRIRNPGGATVAGDKQNWIHGVQVDGAGKALAYSLHRRRNYGSFEPERTVSADNLLLHGYFDRFDQVRGISPIVSALDPLRDIYDAETLAIAKMKVEQLFALAFYRQASDSAGIVTETEDSESATSTKPKYQVDFGGGPVLLDLDPGDRAEFLASNAPGNNFATFLPIVLAVAMKSLDLPYIFADEGAGVFHSFRGSWLIYDRSCESKRGENQELLKHLTKWRLTLAVLDGELTLPRGMTVEQLAFAWNHRGFPWFDPNKELSGDLAAIQAGFDTPQRLTQKRGGGDWYANIEQIAKAREWAEARQVPVSFAPVPQPIEVVEKEEHGRGK